MVSSILAFARSRRSTARTPQFVGSAGAPRGRPARRDLVELLRKAGGGGVHLLLDVAAQVHHVGPRGGVRRAEFQEHLGWRIDTFTAVQNALEGVAHLEKAE